MQLPSLAPPYVHVLLCTPMPGYVQISKAVTFYKAVFSWDDPALTVKVRGVALLLLSRTCAPPPSPLAPHPRLHWS
jgi:hypothetical protein